MEYCEENEEMFRVLMETEPWSYDESDKTVKNSIGDIMIAQCEDKYVGRKLALVPSLIRAIEFAYEFERWEGAAQIMDATRLDSTEFFFELDAEYGFEPDNLEVVERFDRVVGLPYWVLATDGFVKAERIYNYMVAQMVDLYCQLARRADTIMMWGVDAVEANDFFEALLVFVNWKKDLGIE